ADTAHAVLIKIPRLSILDIKPNVGTAFAIDRINPPDATSFIPSKRPNAPKGFEPALVSTRMRVNAPMRKRQISATIMSPSITGASSHPVGITCHPLRNSNAATASAREMIATRNFPNPKIGRASCRERVEDWVGGGRVQENMRR